MSLEITEVADSARPDGGGLQEDPQYCFDAQELANVYGCGCRQDGQSRGLEMWSRAESETVGKAKPRIRVNHVGGLVAAFGEPDIDLVLEDGSRLPVHSCLLVAFSGTFRDHFLRPRRHRCRLKDRAQSVQGGTGSKCQSAGTLANAEPPVQEAPAAEVKKPVADAPGDVDQRNRSRELEPLLARVRDAGSSGRPQAPASTSAAAVAAAAFAATSIAEQTAWPPPAIVYWGSKRGEVLVRFWGAGTMAAVVQHLYTGKAPSGVHVEGLGRLLVAAVCFRMSRLMRQVEHLLSASLSSKKSNTRAAQHAGAARLLRAARVLRAKDLEDRCTLYLQENGVFPAVMKVKRIFVRLFPNLCWCWCSTSKVQSLRCVTVFPLDLMSPSMPSYIMSHVVATHMVMYHRLFCSHRENLGRPKIRPTPVRVSNILSVAPGAAHSFSPRIGRDPRARSVERERISWVGPCARVDLFGGGYDSIGLRCGDGGKASCRPFSAQARRGFRPASAATARPKPVRLLQVTAARTFPEVVLDTSILRFALDRKHSIFPQFRNRCASTLAIGQPERAILLEAALADACPRNRLGIPRGLDKVAWQVTSPQQRRQSSRGSLGCCNAADRVSGEGRRERPAVPLVSNFSAFSHDISALLRTGAMADVVLILPERLDDSGAVDQAAMTSESGRNMTEEGRGEHGEGLLEQDGRERLTSYSRHDEGETTGVRQSNRFLAHSMILSCRSEKFAAMLRFVRRQDAATSSSVASDGSSSESGTPDDEDGSSREAEDWNTGNVCADDEQASLLGRVEQQGVAYHHEDGNGGFREGDDGGVARSSFQESNHRLSGQGHHKRCCHYRVRRDPAPREMELQSPLLSPRSLGLFLDFLYTGVLIPSLSTRELSELTLIADEYLVPDLTRQAEALLVECLVRSCVRMIDVLQLVVVKLIRVAVDVDQRCFSAMSALHFCPWSRPPSHIRPPRPSSNTCVTNPNNGSKTSRNVDGPAHFSSSMGQKTGSGADDNRIRREDDTASTPLELLQLGISLGLAELSTAAARSVLLHLETVSRSEAFEASGMSKRELVVAALEAIRS